MQCEFKGVSIHLAKNKGITIIPPSHSIMGSIEWRLVDYKYKARLLIKVAHGFYRIMSAASN